MFLYSANIIDTDYIIRKKYSELINNLKIMINFSGNLPIIKKAMYLNSKKDTIIFNSLQI